MESHKRLLSILHIAYGALHLVGYLVVHLIFSTMAPFILEEISRNGDADAANIVGVVFMVVKSIAFIFIVILPLPSIIGGIAQLNNRSWGMTLMMISGCISLLNIPVGTALGVYTIWVYLEEKKHNDSTQK